MVRIAGSTEKGRHIREEDYYTPYGEMRVDKSASPTMQNCLMYKLSYYRFWHLQPDRSEFEMLAQFWPMDHRPK